MACVVISCVSFWSYLLGLVLTRHSGHLILSSIGLLRPAYGHRSGPLALLSPFSSWFWSWRPLRCSTMVGFWAWPPPYSPARSLVCSPWSLGFCGRVRTSRRWRRCASRRRSHVHRTKTQAIDALCTHADTSGSICVPTVPEWRGSWPPHVCDSARYWFCA